MRRIDWDEALQALACVVAGMIVAVVFLGAIVVYGRLTQ